MISSLSGVVIFSVAVLTVLFEWSGADGFARTASAGMILYIVLAAPTTAWSRWVFVAIAVGLSATALVIRPDGADLVHQALKTACLIGAFFVALTWLRNAAATSPAIEACGQYLAEQPPGRRYLALNTGGHLFAIILSYGAISLLGNLAVSSARHETNEEIRLIRTRRMLLAIQRGFVAMLCWSPLSFSMVISVSIVPGASWEASLGICLVSAGLLTALGWGIDSIFKPRLTGPAPPRVASRHNWRSLTPLLALLAILVTCVGSLTLLTGIRAFAVVMVFVPILSLSWIALQTPGSPSARIRSMWARTVQYITGDLVAYRSELVLLTMAGLIGTVGSALLAPIVATSGLDLADVPVWLILTTIVWLVPAAGQLGMNPLLSVSLFAPLLPDPATIDVSASVIVLALTSGWALTGASSPFTATTMLVGSLGGVSAYHARTRWNGAFTVLGATLLSAWAVVASGF